MNGDGQAERRFEQDAGPSFGRLEAG